MSRDYSNNNNDTQQAEITFLEGEETYDFVDIVEGEKITHIFEFTNSSDVPLIISNAEGSCGCTVPEKYNQDPVLPGEKGSITVVFDSEGRAGIVTKSVRIYANTYPSETLVFLKGNIISPK